MSPWKPHLKTGSIIAAACEIVEDARQGGYRFTLRRVFYALVSIGVIPNTERAYKSLSATLDRARWEGLLPPDALDDLQRVTSVSPSWLNARDFAESVIPQYRTDWWSEADPLVEVWAEKAAVTGIVKPVTEEYGVCYLAMRGFGSFTAVYEAAQRFEGRSADVIYVGDWDPSGVEMDRDLNDRLTRMGADAMIHRVALTYDQVEEYDLLPQPVKQTDSRAAGWDYEGSWELDALDADTLAALVRDAIEERLPPGFEDARDRDIVTRVDLAADWS